MSDSIYADINSVVHLSSWGTSHCKHCNTHLDGEKLEAAINHYMQAHEYKLLHVGTESVPFTGGPCFATVAVLGK